MNIHPLFVHFPIGMLVVYSVLEIGAYFLPALRRQSWLFPVKTFLLLVGVLAAFAALVTGGITEGILKEEADPNFFMVETHSSFAAATTILYIILAGAYLIRVFDQNGWGDRIAGTNNLLIRLWNWKKKGAHVVLDTWLLPVLALVALVGMFVTGALGAAIVYGPDEDPFITFVYHLFWAE